MPTKKYATRRRTRRTRKRFMPASLAVKRYNQVSTKVFYFKGSGTINSDPVGNVLQQWNTQYPPINTGDPQRMPNVADSYTIAECYNSYKILAVKVRLFASNLGTEPGQSDAPNPPIPGFNRGSTVIYLDQDIRPNTQVPIQITEVINYGSARMIPSRADRWTVTMYRKRGVPEWGTCDRNVSFQDRVPDPWNASVNFLGNFASTTQRPLWFYVVTYKIIFRGRSYT